MSEELEKMFADLRDYEWYTPFQEGVDELKAKVEEELKTSKRAELEEIKEAFCDMRDGYPKITDETLTVREVLEVIDRRIKELNNE